MAVFTKSWHSFSEIKNLQNLLNQTYLVLKDYFISNEMCQLTPLY